MEERLEKSRELLRQNNLKVDRKPDPVAVYFRGIRRGPLGTVRSALRESLPGWALLGLSFVGNSILEIVTDRRQKDHLTATLSKLGVHEVKEFDIIKQGMKKREPNVTEAEATKENIQRAISRLSRCAATCKGEAVRGWYGKMLMEAKRSMAELSNSESTSNGDGSEEDANTKTDNAQPLKDNKGAVTPEATTSTAEAQPQEQGGSNTTQEKSPVQAAVDNDEEMGAKARPTPAAASEEADGTTVQQGAAKNGGSDKSLRSTQ